MLEQLEAARREFVMNMVAELTAQRCSEDGMRKVANAMTMAEMDRRAEENRKRKELAEM